MTICNALSTCLNCKNTPLTYNTINRFKRAPFLRTLFLFFVLILSENVHSQKQDSLRVTVPILTTDTTASKWKVKWTMSPHSPLKATVYSAILPGAGQAYNKKYWKIPIVAAGLGTCVFMIHDNNKHFQYFKREYIARVDNNPTTVATALESTDYLNRSQEQYHKWRDVSYLALLGVYVFQMIDANVDGHLFYFDASEDLSFQLSPTVIPGRSFTGGLGLTMQF